MPSSRRLLRYNAHAMGANAIAAKLVGYSRTDAQPSTSACDRSNDNDATGSTCEGGTDNRSTDGLARGECGGVKAQGTVGPDERQQWWDIVVTSGGDDQAATVLIARFIVPTGRGSEPATVSPCIVSDDVLLIELSTSCQHPSDISVNIFITIRFLSATCVNWLFNERKPMTCFAKSLFSFISNFDLPPQAHCDGVARLHIISLERADGASGSAINGLRMAVATAKGTVASGFGSDPRPSEDATEVKRAQGTDHESVTARSLLEPLRGLYVLFAGYDQRLSVLQINYKDFVGEQVHRPSRRSGQVEEDYRMTEGTALDIVEPTRALLWGQIGGGYDTEANSDTRASTASPQLLQWLTGAVINVGDIGALDVSSVMLPQSQYATTDNQSQETSLEYSMGLPASLLKEGNNLPFYDLQTSCQLLTIAIAGEGLQTLEMRL